MFAFNLNALISGAQKGDPICREKLIERHYSLIAKVCSKACGRYLAWENDDELSIGLMAFNEAIDAFDTKGRIKFTTFAGVVIKRRLIDYFRKQAKYEQEMLHSADKENNELDASIIKHSVNNYYEVKAGENLANVMAYYKELLDGYGIEINRLPEVSPKHRSTRENLLKAAVFMARDQEMLHYLQQYGHLPVKNLCTATGLSRKILERGRKYIIAIALILTDPHLTPLKRFADIPVNQGDESYAENQSSYHVV